MFKFSVSFATEEEKNSHRMDVLIEVSLHKRLKESNRTLFSPNK